MLVSPVSIQKDHPGRGASLRSKPADAGESDLRKGPAPGPDESGPIGPRRKRQEKLVVFAVAERRPQAGSAALGNGGGNEGGLRPRRRQGREVLGEPVAHIDHRADFAPAGEPRSLGQAGLESKMVPALHTRPELPGDEDPVARTRSLAREDSRAGGLAQQGENGGESVGLGD